MVFNTLLSPILNPLLVLKPLYVILILAFIITFLITLAYKFFTDQEEMQRLKDKMQDYQDKIKEAQQDDPEEAMDIQKEAMQVNLEYMKHSIKPTIITFLPIIIIFGWMNSHLAYHPIAPGEPFNVSVQMEEGLPGEVSLDATPDMDIEQRTKQAAQDVQWTVSADEPGVYTLTVRHGDNEFNKDVQISDTTYESRTENYDGVVKRIKIHMDAVHPLGSLSIFGYQPGWLVTYILFSIVMSMGLRKAMGVV